MPLFENLTPEIIKARVLERIGTDLQTREGSYTNDLVAPVCFELWRWCMTLDELITAFYVDEQSGAYLDKHAALLGMARKAGTRASAQVVFSGRAGLTVPAGTVFLTAGGLEFTLEEAVTLGPDGTGTGQLRAAEVGDAYNVSAGEISRVLRNIPGLAGWSSQEAAGGTDPESDGDLFRRIDERRKRPATSGNEAHYREWALSCDGVGDCKVTGLWDGAGTVRVLLVDYDRQPVDASVVSACAAYIQTQRPVGADVTVVSATGTAINVSAAVVLQEGVSLADVKAAYRAKVDAYLRELAFQQYTVYVNRVASLLMDVEGVTDYSGLTVNGGTANITIAATAVPVVGEVTLS